MRSKKPGKIISIIEESAANNSASIGKGNNSPTLKKLGRYKFFYLLLVVVFCLGYLFISLNDKKTLSKHDYIFPQSSNVYFNSEEVTIYLGDGFSSQGFYVYNQNTRLYQILSSHQNIIKPNPKIDLTRKILDGEVLSSTTLGDVYGKKPINEANISLLKSVSGIGESTAQKILDYISLHSPKYVDDLINVEGVGEKTLENLREYFY